MLARCLACLVQCVRFVSSLKALAVRTLSANGRRRVHLHVHMLHH